MIRSYEISPRAEAAGAGWNLKLFIDGQEAGGGAFPILEESPADGMTWWNNLSEGQRAHWLKMANSAVPAAAHHAFLLAEAYNDALDEAESWVGPE